MDQIVLNHVTKQFTTKTLGTVTAVNDFNLTIKEGECFSFLGPSGCGKTTTLRMIAGFEDLSDGEIHLAGPSASRAKTCMCRRRSAGWAWCSSRSRYGRT